MSTKTKTNILFILTDDQGVWAAGCYGNPEIRTPNIDRIAATGAASDTPSPGRRPASIIATTRAVAPIRSHKAVWDQTLSPHRRCRREYPFFASGSFLVWKIPRRFVDSLDVTCLRCQARGDSVNSIPDDSQSRTPDATSFSADDSLTRTLIDERAERSAEEPLP